MKDLKNINYAWAALMIEELIRQDVAYFCVAPGSRSSPLTMAVAEHPKAQHIVHFDERGLAFHALGYVSATRKPAVLICTSGTAGANFYPAVIEASKKKLPLIVLTADRPPELQYTGAMQTINQTRLYGDFTKWFFNMPCPTEEIKPEMVLTTIDQAVHQAQSGVGGVVHLNCAFREPLSPVKDRVPLKKYLSSISKWLKNHEPWTTYYHQTSLGIIDQIDALGDLINKSKHVLIVVGKLKNSYEREVVQYFAQSLNAPLLVDISSGLRTGCSENIIPYADQILLSSKAREQLKPDVVIHLGGRMTSKRYYEWIEQSKPKTYVMVLAHSLRNDPLHNVTHRIQGAPSSFCDALIPHVNQIKEDDYLNCWKSFNQWVSKKIKLEHESERNVELSIARTISQLIPCNEGLFLSNSMPVRFMDMFADPDGHPVNISANRGASGIDGILGTAIGYAQGLQKRVTCLVGDQACLYDLNSLAMINHKTKPLVFVVLNNQGGAIFRHLPIAENNVHFEPFFQVRHQFTFKHVANMFNIHYLKTTNKAGFEKQYQKALSMRKSVLIEVGIDPAKSVHDLRQFQQKVIKNLV